ncbi:hypothetical protein Tco_1335354 [Tanacetum coccineum]
MSSRIMNYEPIVAGTQSNGFASTKASDNAGQARKETKPVKNYILLPLWLANLPFSQDPKSSQDDGSMLELVPLSSLECEIMIFDTLRSLTKHNLVLPSCKLCHLVNL